ncbi:MAG: response regulator [Polyangiaceae bacterium]
MIDRLRPGILITDLAMPDVNGLELLDHLQRLVPSARAIVVTMMSDGPFVRHAMRLRGLGISAENAMPDELPRGRAIGCCGPYICKELQSISTSPVGSVSE